MARSANAPLAKRRRGALRSTFHATYGSGRFVICHFAMENHRMIAKGKSVSVKSIFLSRFVQ
jgi:hypothetical protein